MRLPTPAERVVGILVAEPLGSGRVYLCAYASEGEHGWLALDEAGAPVASRETVRQLERQALEKLRRTGRAAGLKPYASV